MKTSIAIVTILALVIVFFIGVRYEKSRQTAAVPTETSDGSGAQTEGTISPSSATPLTAVKIPSASFVPVQSDITADVVYNCGHQTMHAIYYKNEHAAKITLSDGRIVMVGYAGRANGDRYTNATGSFVFLNTGPTATVTENGKVTYGNCPQYE